MGRPAKAVATKTGTITKEEEAFRRAQESALRGSCDNIKPPAYLTDTQRGIFNAIVRELKATGILGNLDVYVLAQGSIVIDRVQTIESEINCKPNLLYDTSYMSTKKKYTDEFWRFCNEMSLSPQSRAKMAGIGAKIKSDEEDPLIKAMAGGNRAP